MARKSPGPNGICKAGCRCIPCARMWITASLRPTPRTESLESSAGFIKARSCPAGRRRVRPQQVSDFGRADFGRSEFRNGVFLMLMPKKVKYRKQQRGRMRGKAWRGSSLEFGDFGLKTLDAAWITDRQIEAGRIAITRFVKRGGKVWIRIFPDKPVTKKPAETRMGKGKGAPEYWVAVVKPGRIIYEMEGVPESVAREAMRLAAQKLPVHTKFVMRLEKGGEA